MFDVNILYNMQKHVNGKLYTKLIIIISIISLTSRLVACLVSSHYLLVLDFFKMTGNEVYFDVL